MAASNLGADHLYTAGSEEKVDYLCKEKNAGSACL